MSRSSVGPRGRGQQSPAARYFPLLLGLLVGACSAQDASDANAHRTIRADAAAGSGCNTLPDTTAELVAAQTDRNDLPDTRIELDPDCPRASVLFLGGARLERTYRVQVPAGQWLVVRARGERAPLALAFDYPARPKPDSSNVGRVVIDSLRADADREVAIRVMPVPHVKNDPRETLVLLTVLVRP